MGSFSRWFSRSRKKRKEETPGNPLFAAFSSTPIVDHVIPQPRRSGNTDQFKSPPQIGLNPVPAVQPSQGVKTNAGRADPALRDRDLERWNQQLLAWRLSAYEDARKWDMIDAETHKILRHHAFLSPGGQAVPGSSMVRPSLSAPAGSQTFVNSPIQPKAANTASSPRKRPSTANPLPPSSWSRPAPPLMPSESDVPASRPRPSAKGAPIWDSFLSIPSSPTRSRSRFGQSLSVTSLPLASSSAQGDPPTVLKKERKRDSLRSPFVGQPLDMFDTGNGGMGTSSEADLELLSRTKRGMLTDDSSARSIRAEWTRTKAEMRTVCGQGGLFGVVGKIEKEVDGWKRKCKVEMLLQDAQDDLDEQIRVISDLVKGISSDGAASLATANYLEVPTTPNRRRSSIESLETVMPAVDSQSVTGSFLNMKGLRTKPSFVSLNAPSANTSPSKSPGKPQRTPSHLSSRSVQSLYADLGRKATGSGLLGLNKAVNVSRPITPVQSIVNRNTDIGLAQPQDAGRVNNLLLLADLRKLEMALSKFVTERNRLENVRTGYQERADLLEVKMNGAELRDRLG